VRDDKTGGPHALFSDGVRRFTTQSFKSLQGAWLGVSQQPDLWRRSHCGVRMCRNPSPSDAGSGGDL